eukprot:TRINITY_DN959_c4_g1_i1.p1 TRINITY_DN959_c4_g1~~TRINITY_DN959_c4_g1_i1.p1  ORF type:complete len:606 (-),score=182.59 TRINITY_DN959_c4_g1_i1:143-1903(-)
MEKRHRAPARRRNSTDRPKTDESKSAPSKTHTRHGGSKKKTGEAEDEWNFEPLLMEKQWSDLIICIGKKKVFAHKVLIAMRSPVLAALIYSDEKRSSSKTTATDKTAKSSLPSSSLSTLSSSSTLSTSSSSSTVSDISKELPEITLDADVTMTTLHHFLNYCYKGKTTLHANDVMDLQTFASKYEVNGLLSICGQALQDETLDVKAAIKLLESKASSNRAFQQSIGTVSEAVLHSKEFNTLTECGVISLFCNPFIESEEYELFKAARAWAHAQCKRQKIEFDTDAEKQLLKNILPHIRFPLMELSDLAQVSSTNVMDTNTMVSLFQYKATASSSSSFSSSSSSSSSSFPFVTMPRECGLRIQINRSSCHPSLKFSKDNLTITQTKNSSWCGAACSNKLENKKSFFAVKIDSLGSSSSTATIALGVCKTPSLACTSSSHYLAGDAYVWSTCSSYCFHSNSSGQKFASVIPKENDICGCLVDPKAGTIEYFLNGKSVGKPFTTCTDLEEYYPFCSLYYANAKITWQAHPKNPAAMSASSSSLLSSSTLSSSSPSRSLRSVKVKQLASPIRKPYFPPMDNGTTSEEDED